MGALTLALSVGLTALTGVLAVYAPLAVALIIVLGLVVFLKKTHWGVYAAIILGLTALPVAVPFSIYVSGVQMYLFEPPLILALIWALRSRLAPRAAQASLLLVFVVALWSAWGILSGRSTSVVNLDARPLVDLLLTIPVAAAVVTSDVRTQALRVLCASQWLSAGLTIVASATGLELYGRSEVASLGVGSAVGQATRYLTSAVEPAVAIVCALLILLALRRVSGRKAMVYGTPSLVIMFLAFSRNHLLGLGVAVAFVLLVAALRRQAGRTLARLALVASIIVGAAVTLPALSPGSSASAWVSEQVQSYSGRVFGGLESSNLQQDPSAAYRELEKPYLRAAIADSPALGHGFGFAYKPPLGSGITFFTTSGRYYAHQYYLWLLVKTGFVGAALVLWVVARPVVWGGMQPGGLEPAAAGALASLLAISVVAPVPNGVTGALVIGGLLGVLYARGLTLSWPFAPSAGEKAPQRP